MVQPRRRHPAGLAATAASALQSARATARHDDRRLAGRGRQRALARRAGTARSAAPSVTVADPGRRIAAPAAGARHQHVGATGANAPRFRGQCLARAAHAVDGDPRLSRIARSGRRAATGWRAQRHAWAIQAHGANRRRSADPVAPGNPDRRQRGARGDGATAGHAASRGRGAQPRPPPHHAGSRNPG